MLSRELGHCPVHQSLSSVCKGGREDPGSNVCPRCHVTMVHHRSRGVLSALTTPLASDYRTHFPQPVSDHVAWFHSLVVLGEPGSLPNGSFRLFCTSISDRTLAQIDYA